jgi:hypothetical protein
VHGERPLFESVFLAGFECSDHLLETGERLDMLSSTRHVELADADYGRLASVGIAACREGVSWVRSERAPSRFDFSACEARLSAAERHGVSIAWDLMHFGWPDHVDPFSPAFPGRFANYAWAFAEWLGEHTSRTPMITPINEMSFLAWAGGDVRVMNPFVAARGVELKAQLVAATLDAIVAIREALPRVRFLSAEPVIQIVANPEHPKTFRRVESDNLLQYQAWDMLCGRVWPTLGGTEAALDVIGVNFYANNQFTPEGFTIHRGDPRYRPFSEMLVEVWQRYRRPMIVSETGAEGDLRAEWLSYVCDECVLALEAGCDLHGVTLYPILNHPGWVDGRHCENGLWDYADASGDRPIHEPLAAELRRQGPRLEKARRDMLERRSRT